MNELRVLEAIYGVKDYLVSGYRKEEAIDAVIEEKGLTDDEQWELRSYFETRGAI